MNEDLRSAVAMVQAVDLGTGEISEADHHHLFTVLRARDAERVGLTDGRGGWRMARVHHGALVPETEISHVPSPEPLEILLAIPKADRPEWIVQKLTEIGVTSICWLHTERGVVRWQADRATKQLERLTKVMVAAALQSRRVWFPVLTGPVAVNSVLSDLTLCEPGGRQLSATDGRLAIGPEGGWSPGELAGAAETVSLGAGILRVETAALVAASVLTHLRRARGVT